MKREREEEVTKVKDNDTWIFTLQNQRESWANFWRSEALYHSFMESSALRGELVCSLSLLFRCAVFKNSTAARSTSSKQPCSG